MPENTIDTLSAILGISLREKSRISGTQDEINRFTRLLKNLGLLPEDRRDPETILKGLLDRLWQSPVKPVHTFIEGSGPYNVPLRLPAENINDVHWQIILEDNTSLRGSIKLHKLRETGSRRCGQLIIIERSVSLDIELPCGYHTLTFSVGHDNKDLSQIATTKVIIAPENCYLPESAAQGKRLWGISMQIHALRSRRNWGIGDFTDVKTVLTRGAEHGSGAFNITPFHAPSVAAENGNPYKPSSRSFFNVLFIDVEAIEDYRESVLQNGDAKIRAKLSYLRDQDVIDYPAVAEVKYDALNKLWETFRNNHLHPETVRGAAFRHFQQEGGELLKFFSLFEALREHYGKKIPGSSSWRTWPESFRNPYSPEVDAFYKENQERIEFHQYLQWQAEFQIALIGRRSLELGLKIGLIPEFAYTSGTDGFESWYYQDLYGGQAVIDSPSQHEHIISPSIGSPAWLPYRLAENHYLPFIKALQISMRQAGALLMREFANYQETDITVAAADGTIKARLTGFFEDLINVVALESHRQKCLIIADDIDRLPADWRNRLRQRAFLPNLLNFRDRLASEEWPTPEDYPDQAVVGLSAPYLPNSVSFWDGIDITFLAAHHFFSDAQAH
ncbi:MAG: 4-alpha-glucanotransferase, partial [Deltaproteobacteria bacterium]|nr:4-alpha-glucanotransferase [Deltaproteobacteria bacterium]